MTIIDANAGDVLYVLDAQGGVIGSLTVSSIKAGRVKLAYDPTAAPMKRVEKKKERQTS